MRRGLVVCHCEETLKGSTWQSGLLSCPVPVRGVASPSQWGGGAQRRWGTPGDSPARFAAFKRNPFLRRIPGTESSRLAHFAVKLVRFDSAGGIPPRLMGNGGEVHGIASSLCLPISMGRWRAAPVGDFA